MSISKMVNEARQYARGRLAAQNKHDAEVQELEEKYGDTPYVKRKTAEADDALKKELARLAADAGPRINALITDMRGRYDKREMIAPSQAQVNALQLLNMRRRVSRDELQEAANLCRGCPATYGLLQDIGRKNGITVSLPKDGPASISWLDSHVNSFVRSFNKLMQDGRQAERIAVWDDNMITGYMFGCLVNENTGTFSENEIKALSGVYDGPIMQDMGSAPTVEKAQQKAPEAAPSADFSPIWEHGGP